VSSRGFRGAITSSESEGACACARGRARVQQSSGPSGRRRSPSPTKARRQAFLVPSPRGWNGGTFHPFPKIDRWKRRIMNPRSFFIQSTHIGVFISHPQHFFIHSTPMWVFISHPQYFSTSQPTSELFSHPPSFLIQSTHIGVFISDPPHFFHPFNSNSSTYFSSTVLIQSTHIQVVSLIHRHISSSQPAFEYLFLIHNFSIHSTLMRVFISHPIFFSSIQATHPPTC
jgi:hypothetical protein